MNLHERGKLRRKQRILDAVVGIVDEEGVVGLTIARVSDRAEVSVKTIYNLMGSLDDILDAMSAAHFSSLAKQLRASDHAPDTRQFFDQFVERSCAFLQSDEQKSRAALKAILYTNIANGRSYRNTPSASDQFKFIARGLGLFRESGYLRPAVNIELLAEQMLYAEAMLLELWATSLIDLERYRLTYKYQLWTLIRAWADESLIEYCDRAILELQEQLAPAANNSKRAHTERQTI